MAEEFGNARFRWNGGSAPWVVRSAIADGMERAAVNVRRAMRRRINKPWPPASRPGQSPRRRTGNLWRSVTYKINRQTLEIWIGPGEQAPYGLYLEYGTKRMAPRPWMFRGLKDEKKRIVNTMNRAAAIAFKKYASRKSKK